MGLTRRLLLFNGLAVIAAVVNHAVGWGYTSLFWWTHRYESVQVPDFAQMGSASYYALRTMEQMVTWGVPAFLFVSGYFVAFAAGHQSPTLGWKTVTARLRMLLVPYLLWSVAIFVGRGLQGTTDTSAGYLRQLLHGGAAEPYYYIPLLTQLYLLSPLIIVVTRNRWRVALISAAILQLTAQAARYPVLLGWDAPAAEWIWRQTPGWFFPHMIFWFVFGVFARLHLPVLKQWVLTLRSQLPWLTAALGVAALLEWELLLALSGRRWLTPTPTVLDTLFCCAAVLTFLAVSQRSEFASGPLDRLGERSFGVYLIHAPILELLSKAVYHLLPALLAYQFVFQPLLVIVGLGVPLLVMAAVNRTAVRPYYNYLFG